MMSRPLFLSLTLMIAAGTMMHAHAQEPDRTIRPTAQKVPTIDLPDIQKAKLTNGLNVWLVEFRELPLVAFNLVIQSGSDHDPLQRSGLASMTADMLDEGTTTRDALKIADDLESIGASLSVRSGTDGSFISLNTLTKHLDNALEVYADIVCNPTFPDKDFIRLRNQRITSILQQKDRPATIATLAFNKILYGEKHPYGADASGTEQSLSMLTRDDVVAFYEKYYRPNNATLIVVGDITLEDLVKHLEKNLSAWRPAPVPAVTFPEVPKAGKQQVYLIDKPGAAQSEVRIGYPAAARNTPDYFPLLVANRILGGQFTSRLNLNLREKHGFSYGVRSNFQFNKQPGPFVASGGVVTAKSDSSVREFLYEIGTMYKDGATAEEVEYVKKGLAGSFALSFETPSQIAGSLQNIVLYNLPEDYYETYLDNISKVTVDDVRRVSSKYFNPEKMAVVVVGDLAVVREGIEALKLGSTVVCDVEGNKLPQ